ncbi:glycosyltransferase family 4 protein [Clostridium perfringens]
MKIVWLTNIILPDMAMKLSKSYSNGGGWLIGLLNDLKKNENIELIVCSPLVEEKEIIKFDIEGVRYYGFPKDKINPTQYDVSVEETLKMILEIEKPDIVHIFGTEFPHTLSMVRAFNKPDKTIINIQGLTSVIAKHYLNGIPYSFQKKYTFRDFIRRDNLLRQKCKFEKRGKYEIEAIKNVDNVIGRTNWDKACIQEINNKISYYFCNETLRDEFYKHKWSINECEKYSIFVSQGSYPVKGLHFILEAMPKLIKKFPKVHLYIAGDNIVGNNSLIDNLKLSSYASYIKFLINKYKLSDYITFLGNLDEKEMCLRFLKTHVFVSSSIIENSPNSLGEAMILGVPCIASYVGGVPDMITHNIEGFLYQVDAPYMLAYYISKIFEDNKKTIELSKNAILRAELTHDKEKNSKRILEIYNQIFSKE